MPKAYKTQHGLPKYAAGNLDFPLEMDKNNIFGAFTESFDLMRDEINKARENERVYDGLRHLGAFNAYLRRTIKGQISKVYFTPHFHRNRHYFCFLCNDYIS